MEKTTTFIIALLVAGLVLTSGILAFKSKTSLIVSSSGEQTTNTITASADSKITVAPDKAELYFRITTDGTTAIEAQDTNKEASNNVLKALQAKGVQETDIESTQYSITKKYIYSRGTPEENGYQAYHVLKVSTTDLEHVGSLADTGVSAGANGLDTIQFTLTDEKQKEVRTEALSKAASLAKEKAQTLAESVGVRLGSLKSVSESNFRFTPYFAESAVAMKADATQISPQNLDVTATVNVVYEIE